MNINLTTAQYTELEVLVLALQNPKSYAGASAIEIKVNDTKIEYDNLAVKVKLSN